MVKIKEYFQIGNRDEMTFERLLVLLEDMYKELALGVNSQSSSEDGSIIAYATINSDGSIARGDGLTAIRTATGRFRITFDTPNADVTYSIIATPQVGDGVSVWSITIGAKAVGYFDVKIKSLGDVFVTPSTFSVVVIG